MLHKEIMLITRVFQYRALPTLQYDGNVFVLPCSYIHFIWRWLQVCFVLHVALNRIWIYFTQILNRAERWKSPLYTIAQILHCHDTSHLSFQSNVHSYSMSILLTWHIECLIYLYVRSHSCSKSAETMHLYYKACRARIGSNVMKCSRGHQTLTVL